MKKIIILSALASATLFAGDNSIGMMYGTSDNGSNDLGSAANSATQAVITLSTGSKEIAGLELEASMSAILTSDKISKGRYVDTVSNSDMNTYLRTATISKDFSRLDTSIKIGRQTISEVKSPLAFTENWTPVENTFDAVTIANESIPDTLVLAGAIIAANDYSDVESFNKPDEPLYFVTAVNNSTDTVAQVSAYYQKNGVTTGDLTTIYSEVSHETARGAVGSIQAGYTFGDVAEDTKMFGIRYLSEVNRDLSVGVAASKVSNGSLAMVNMHGVKTPLFTQMVMNENEIKLDNETATVSFENDTFTKGIIGASYGYTNDKSSRDNDSQEFDLTFNKECSFGPILQASYSVKKIENYPTQNMIRVNGSYTF